MNEQAGKDIVDQPFDRDQAPESKSSTDQYPRGDESGDTGSTVTGHSSLVTGEKTRKEKIFKLSMWIGIPTIALIILLWILHEWLGLWIVSIHHRWNFADSQCEWMMEHMPMWILIDGIYKFGMGTSVLEMKLKPRLEEAVHPVRKT